MRIYDAGFATSLSAAREGSIAPIWFFHVIARNRETGATVPVSIWSGDEDHALSVTGADGVSTTRTYLGGVNLNVEGIVYTADLTDNPVRISLSQIAPAVENLFRALDLRMATCEIHASTWAGGRLSSAPQLQWVGIIDASPVSTPAAGGEGAISLEVRSEMMSQLTAINPAKSSDEHQRRRDSNDGFCRYSGVIGSREVKWFKD